MLKAVTHFSTPKNIEIGISNQ